MNRKALEDLIAYAEQECFEMLEVQVPRNDIEAVRRYLAERELSNFVWPFTNSIELGAGDYSSLIEEPADDCASAGC